MEKNVGFAFPTPVGNFHVPESDAVNRELRELILAREPVSA